MNKKLTQIILVLLTLAASISQAQVDTFTVTKITDFDPFLYQDNPDDTAIAGTLQWAIRKANDAVNPCLIIFNIPGNGTHTIALTYQLPSLNNEITIDATTQIGYAQWNPAVIIDGWNIITNGFIIHNQQCEIKGLYIRKFGVGISVLSPNFKIDNNVINQCIDGIDISSNYGEVTGNIIGTDITMSGLLKIRQYGIFVGGNNNIFGGTQFGKSNIITNCIKVGIMNAAISSQNLFSGNQIFNNPSAIFYKATPLVSKPIINSIINGFASGISQPNCRIELFGSTGNENANEYLTSVNTDANGNLSVIVTTSYPYIVATAIDQNNNTSVLSTAVTVPALIPGSTCTAAIPLPPATYSCSGTQLQMTDSVYWMKFTADTSSMRIAIKKTHLANEININKISLYSGDCNSLQQIATKNKDSGELLNINENNFIDGNTYFIKVEQTTANSGYFELCLQKILPQDTNSWTGQIFIKTKTESFPILQPYNILNDDTISSTITGLDSIAGLAEIYKIEKTFDKGKHYVDLDDIYTIYFSNTNKTNDLINFLANNNKILYAEHVPLMQMDNSPSDYNASNQWSLVKINATLAWGIFPITFTTTPTNIVIAVVDNAIDINHYDLFQNIWTNDDVNGDGIDNDGNGYVDDLHGWNFGSGNNDVTPMDFTVSHGTHVAGIASAMTANGTTGIAALSSNCQIMPLKCYYDADHIINERYGVKYAIDNGANIINMSFGSTTYSNTWQTLLTLAHNMGIVLVAAAGNANEETPHYPAAYDYVISVGNSDENDLKADDSNFGEWVDIMAPGTNILSTIPVNIFGQKSGTSMSAPLVSSLCGLMLSMNSGLTPNMIEDCIKSNAFNIYPLNSSIYTGKLGAGRIDAYQTMLCVQNISQQPPQVDLSSNFQTVCVDDQVPFTWKKTLPYLSDPYPSPAGFLWTITPNTYTLIGCNLNSSSPTIQFNATGEYTIELTVTNAYGSSTSTKIDYIHVINNGNYYFLSPNMDNTWYMGNGAGLKFNQSLLIPLKLEDGAINTHEAAASISNQDGNLLFYSDGYNIYNRFHQPMNGSPLFSPPSYSLEGSIKHTHQGVLIVPSPGDCSYKNIFYVFSHDDMGGYLYVSKVDMNLNNGLGGILTYATKVITPNFPSGIQISEHLTATLHCNNNDIWILTQKPIDNYAPNNTMYAIQLTNMGFSSIQSSSFIPPDLGYAYMSHATNTMKVSPDRSLVGVTYIASYRVVVFNFDANTGIFTYNPNNLVQFNYYPMDIEFSPDNSKIYISTDASGPGIPEQLFQSPVNNLSALNLIYQTTNFQNDGTTSNLQLAPDNKIYVNTEYSPNGINFLKSLGIINDPNQSSCNYLNHIPFFNIRSTKYSFINTFISRIMYSSQQTMSLQNTYTLCHNSTCTIAANPSLSNYQWYGPSGLITGATTNTLVVAVPGTYYLHASVPSNPACPMIAQTTVIEDYFETSITIDCNQNPVILAVDNFQSYQWSNGASTQQIAINTLNQAYSVTVTDENNCSASASIFATCPLEINATSTNTVCINSSTGTATVNVTVGSVEPFSYLWSNGQISQTATGLGMGIYYVTVTDDVGNTATASTTVSNLYSPPSVTLSSTATALCQNQPASFTITAVASGLLDPVGSLPPAPFYQWSNNQMGQTLTSINVSVTPTSLTPLTYTVTLTDLWTGCNTSNSITIPVNPIPSIDINTPACITPGPTFGYTVSLTPPDPTATYSWNFGDGSGTTSSSTFPVTFHTYPYDGNYCISLSAQGTCSASTKLNVYITPKNCACPSVQSYDDINNPSLLNISASTSWPPPGYTTLNIYGTVTIQPTCTLTISNGSIIHFGPQAKIIVSKTAVLDMKQNSILTNLSTSCQTLWQGVEVWGDGTSNDASQGKIIIEENATITNAHIGVLLGKRKNVNVCNYNPADVFDPAFGGGIIQATTANFTGNGIGVKFSNKSNINITLGSFFTNCIFFGGNLYNSDMGYKKVTGTPYYPNKRNPWAGAANHLGISPAGIFIEGNKGLLIDGDDAGTEPIEKNTFKRSFTGIESYNSKCIVTNNDFDFLWYGVYISNSSYSLNQYNKIVSNYFTMIPGPYTLVKPSPSAIYISSGYGDVIRDNFFGDLTMAGISQLYNLTGVTVIKSKKLQILDNNFKRNKWGIIINGNDNGSIVNNLIGWGTQGNQFLQTWQNMNGNGDNSKLKIKCNNSNDNSTTPADYNSDWVFKGPLTTQGSLSIPAGNRFNPDDLLHKKITNNDNSLWYTYYYNSNLGQFYPNPVGNFHLNPGNTYNPDDCPLSTFALNQYPSLISQANSRINQLQIEFQQVFSTLDKGQTAALLAAVNTNSNGVLKTKLVNASPLSDEVILAVINKTNPLPPGNFKEVMERNLPVSDTIYPDFSAKLATLPYGIKNQLTALQANNTVYRTLTSISRDLIAAQDEYTRLKGDYIGELINQGMTNQAIAYLKTDSSNAAKTLLAGTYTALDSIAEAGNILSSFVPETQDEDDWKTLQTLLLYYSDSGRSIYDMDSLQIVFVRTLAEQEPPSLASAQSWAVLGLLYGDKFDITLDETNPGSASRYAANNNSYSSNVLKAKNIDFNLYPNPASKELNIEYSIEIQQEIFLEIYDIIGNKLKVIKLNSKANSLKISVDGFASGMYFYQFVVDGEVTYKDKLIINK